MSLTGYVLINYGCAISYVGKQVCRLYYYFVYYLASGGLILAVKNNRQ